MKRLFFIMCVLFSVTMSSMAYPHFVPRVHRTYHRPSTSSHVSTTSRSPTKPHVTHPSHSTHNTPHSTPKAYYKYNNTGQMMLYFMIARNVNHHRYNDVDYVRCPICHKVFIVKGRKCCTTCSRR